MLKLKVWYRWFRQKSITLALRRLLVIRGVPLLSVFSIYNILSYLAYFAVYSGILYILCSYAIEDTQYEHRNRSVKILKNKDPNTLIDDIKLRCSAINCIYAIKYDDKTDEPIFIIENLFEEGMILHTNKKKMDEILSYLDHYSDDEFMEIDNVKYIFHVHFYNVIKHKVYLSLLILFLCITLPIHFVREFFKLYATITDTRFYKDQLESKLQRELTESLHHELNPSVSLLNVFVREIYTKLFPGIPVVNYTHIDVTEEIREKYKNGITVSPEVTKELLDTHLYFDNAINRMSSVLTIICNSKHLKYNNESVSIMDMVDSAYCSLIVYQIHKPNIEYENKELLFKHTVGNGLSSGLLANIMTVMFMNSIEAKADKLKVKAEFGKPGFLDIYVEDNGEGIRKSDGEVMSMKEVEGIFVYGYSTKDPFVKPMTLKERIILAIVEGIFSRFYSLDSLRERSSRGSGLSFNQTALRSVGGDIVVVNTSKDGTIFKLSVPIKELRADKK